MTDWSGAERPFECPWFRVERSGTWHRVVNASGAVAVPILPDGRMLFVEHFRHATGRVSLELPRGGALAGEGAVETASRETAEETGHAVVPGTAREVGGFHPDQGVLSGWAAVVACEAEAGSRQGCDGEVENVVPLFPAEATRMIADGEIVCGATIAALSLWALA